MSRLRFCFEPSGFEPRQYYFGSKPTDFGVGQVDVLVHSTDTGTVTESLLGWFRSADVTIQRYYVGQGDKDYALVKNFNNNDKNVVVLGRKTRGLDLRRCRCKSADMISRGNGQAIAENTSYSNLQVQGLFPDFGIIVVIIP